MTFTVFQGCQMWVCGSMAEALTVIALVATNGYIVRPDGSRYYPK